MKKKRQNGFLIAGISLTGLLVLLILIGQLWTPYDPAAMAVGDKLSPPDGAHLFGTDQFGRDVFSRVLKGAGTTLAVALATVAIGVVFGTLVGALTGYFGGVTDALLMRVNDTVTAFPAVLLALVIISLTGPGKTYNVILALGIVFIPSFARVTRTAFASLSTRNFVTAALLQGVKIPRLLLVHLLPNVRHVLLTAVTIGFNNAVLAEAGMSYLGIGVTPPDASLGYMLSEAQTYFVAAPWYALCTGAVLVLLVFGVGLIGEGLEKNNQS